MYFETMISHNLFIYFVRTLNMFIFFIVAPGKFVCARTYLLQRKF
jgi:hypothetical protein